MQAKIKAAGQLAGLLEAVANLDKHHPCTASLANYCSMSEHKLYIYKDSGMAKKAAYNLREGRAHGAKVLVTAFAMIP